MRNQMPFITRVDYEDRTEFRLFDGTVHTMYRKQPSAQPKESTGLIRYVLAQAVVIGGLVYGIADNDPCIVAGAMALSGIAGGWFIRKLLRRERNTK